MYGRTKQGACGCGCGCGCEEVEDALLQDVDGVVAACCVLGLERGMSGGGGGTVCVLFVPWQHVACAGRGGLLGV